MSEGKNRKLPGHKWELMPNMWLYKCRRCRTQTLPGHPLTPEQLEECK